MTLKMTTAQVVKTSVTVTNSSFQNYTHPDDHTTQTTDTPGFKPFTMLVKVSAIPCQSCDDRFYCYIGVNFTFGLLDCVRYQGYRYTMDR